MAPPQGLNFRKVLPVFFLLLAVLGSVFVSAHTQTTRPPKFLSLSNEILRTRKLLEVQKEEDDQQQQPTIKKKKPTTSTNLSLSSKDLSKPIKPSSSNSTKNQIKLAKLSSSSSSYDSSQNKTKPLKPTLNSTKETIVTLKSQLKKLNSTSKTSNSTKNGSITTKKSSDLMKLSSPKNKTTTTKQIQTPSDPKYKSQEKKPKLQSTQKPKQPTWFDEDEGDDLVTEFRHLPSKFHETLLPDLERISTTSRDYLNTANKQIRNGIKPIVGNKYAPTIASIVSFAFIVIPLILVSLIFNRIKAYFSLQKLLIFIQIYLAIYFSILCLSSLVTGLEPLRFFYATSQSTYICLQVLQTLAYVLYLLLLVMYLVLVFSTETGIPSKLLGLAQTIVGYAVGLHYYVTVFHRAVLREPPKTNWRVHAVYATCFLLICLLARAERRKKAYMEESGEEGKKN